VNNMKTLHCEASSRAVRYLITPGVALLAATAVLGPVKVAPDETTHLSAATSPLRDEDGDGLVFHQELILETWNSAADTDSDGFGDAEELARNTSPLLAEVHPTNNLLDVGITARGEPGGLHALIAVYVPDSRFDALDVKVGILAGRRLLFLRSSIVMASSNIDFVPGADPSSSVALLDFRFPRSWVDATGHLTMFTTVSHVGSSDNEAAAAMDLFNIAGIVVLAMPDPHYIPPQGITGGSPHPNPGTVYKPLTILDGEPPAGWAMGEVCFQYSSTVMVSGAVAVHEISSAECQGGWEGACPPTCSSSVGSTYTTVDPAVLVGG